jgi:hypothetical protein
LSAGCNRAAEALLIALLLRRLQKPALSPRRVKAELIHQFKVQS